MKMKKLFSTFLINTLFICPNMWSYDTFWDWKKACDSLPAEYKQPNKPNPYTSRLTWEQFSAEIDSFFETMKKQLQPNEKWYVKSKPNELPSQAFFDFSRKLPKLEPYLQHMTVPVGSKIASHGDFHGDIHSMNTFIEQWAKEGYLDSENPFRIKNPNFYIIFLGDYVDRGFYGAEVLYTVLRLKNTNPDNVFILRGNHEDTFQNSKFREPNTFIPELKEKFKKSEPELTKVFRTYDLMPLAIFLGSGTSRPIDLILYCHGGLEMGVNPKSWLESDPSPSYMKLHTLMRRSALDEPTLQQVPSVQEIKDMLALPKPTGPVSRAKERELTLLTGIKDGLRIATDNGFMWSDFVADDRDLDIYLGTRAPGILDYGRDGTTAMLNYWSNPNSHIIRAVFRAHQHTDPDMVNRINNNDGQGHPDDEGLGKLWIQDRPQHKANAGSLENIKVVTFPVSPRLGYRDLEDSDYFGLLTTAETFKNWHLKAYKIEKSE